jgi:hypothetical protein
MGTDDGCPARQRSAIVFRSYCHRICVQEVYRSNFATSLRESARDARPVKIATLYLALRVMEPARLGHIAFRIIDAQPIASWRATAPMVLFIRSAVFELPSFWCITLSVSLVRQSARGTPEENG